MTIPNWLKILSNVFKNNNKKLYLVGGYVRDHVMGLDGKDYDLCTDALPDEILIMLKKDYHLNQQGKKFGVIVAFGKDLPNEGVEIATFRKDLTYGRHPEIQIGVSIDADVNRRDMTISGLFYDLETNKIVDLVGGIDDIKKGVIRMIGNPIERIKEDQLRAMRVARFAARYGFKIDFNTKKAIIENADLSEISKERISEEIMKAEKQSKSLCAYFLILKDLNLLEKIFFKSKLNNPVICFNTIELIMSQLLLNNDYTKFHKMLVDDYKFNNNLMEKVKFLVSFKDFKPENVLSYYRKYEQLEIDHNTLSIWLKTNFKDLIKFLKYKPVHNSQELMDIGYTGKQLGDKIKEIEKINYNSI